MDIIRPIGMYYDVDIENILNEFSQDFLITEQRIEFTVFEQNGMEFVLYDDLSVGFVTGLPQDNQLFYLDKFEKIIGNAISNFRFHLPDPLIRRKIHQTLEKHRKCSSKLTKPEEKLLEDIMHLIR